MLPFLAIVLALSLHTAQSYHVNSTGYNHSSMIAASQMANKYFLKKIKLGNTPISCKSKKTNSKQT